MPWSAAIVGTVLADNVDRTSYTYLSSSVTPNRLLKLDVSTGVAAGTALPPTITDNHGVTWELIEDATFGTVNGLWTYVGLSGPSPSVGTIVFDFGAVTQTYCDAQVTEIETVLFSGKTATEHVREHIPSNGTGLTSHSFNLTNAPLATSRCFSAFLIFLNEAVGPRVNWTELADAGHNNPTRRLEGQWRSDAAEQTASASWTTSTSVRATCIEVLSAPNPAVADYQPPRATRTAPRRARGSRAQIPAQTAPPTRHSRPSRRRAIFLRRGRHTDVPPNAAPPAPPPDCALVFTDGSSYLGLVGGVDYLELAECNALVFIPGPARRRRPHVPRVRRSRIEVVPAQVVQANPAFTFARPSRRVVRALLRRSKVVVVVQPQPVPPAAPERRLARGRFRRGQPTNVVPAQVTQINPAFVFTRTQRRVQRGWLRVRGRQAQPVPTQVIQINPALPGNMKLRRRVLAWFLRRRPPRTPITVTGPSILDAPTPTTVAGPDGRSFVAGPSGATTVSGPDGRSTVAGPTGSTIVR